MKGKALVVSGMALVALGCGTGVQNNNNNNTNTSLNCPTNGYRLYLGYYMEDPQNNPEDPTTGGLIACIPDGNGTFRSQFVFSYYGCQGGIDKGDISGNRSGNNINGNWNGNVDGRSVGGSFTGQYNNGAFSGTWTNSGGKLQVQVGSCNYYVAGNGTWVLYQLDSDNGGLNINVSGNPPTISWNNNIQNVGGFLVSVYDKSCMYSKVSLSDCTTWSAACGSNVRSVTYGNINPLSGCGQVYPTPPNQAQKLVSGKEYVVSITAFGGNQNNVSDIKAYASKTFTAP